ncbi:phage NrS-1 polymerase family protein [Natrinema salaciae]|uniref:NrS-1 polymerase-like HBD domain-containing protein n=1 Tax=Natrinema salaciae TaxID=1186196 RepID=A0A1H9CJG3_9EURY|nr:hypothetical protein [Natrinema salaciae]SEQ01342.1 hypothetical protein SAMN04489841_1071 [Natrinema salaciae]
MTGSGTGPLEIGSIPTALQEHEQWICWRTQERDGKATKVPIVPGTGDYASATDPGTWRSFDDALEYYQRGDAAGIGFVFTQEDPFVGVDLDDCRDPETGAPNDAAREIIVELDSFTEVSPSGTGYHVLIRGSIPGDRSRRGPVEMYETARFFTVTGDHVNATPARVIERDGALEAVYNEYIGETESPRNKDRVDAQQDAPSESESGDGVTLEDEELLERARNATNGEKFERLWRGSTAGYESQSEADMALCCLLAFWTGGDAARVDRLFRQSGLLRDKWDEVHYADGSTYGEKTVERAIASTDDVYDPTQSRSDDEGRTTKTEAQQTDTSSGQPVARDDQGSEPIVGGSTGARVAHLTEKNQLLTDRIAELENALEQKNERIQNLEEEVERLEAVLLNRESVLDERVESSDEHKDGMGTTSVWAQAKQLFRSNSD